MSPESQGPSPHQEVMNQQIDAAREATMASGQYNTYRQDGMQTETMRTAEISADGIDSTQLQVDTRRDGYERTDAKVFKTTPQGSVEYHAYDVQDPLSYTDTQYGAVHVTRRNEGGEVVSEQRHTNPETVRKFGSLIAKQVTERAKTAQHPSVENERRAA